jgi:hypothetical protein
MDCALSVEDIPPGAVVLDWGLDDPDGRSVAEVDRIRDEIERRVNSLFDETGSRCWLVVEAGNGSLNTDRFPLGNAPSDQYSA